MSRKPQPIILPPELAAELGTDTDTALAAKYGISVQKVRLARLRAGLEPGRKSKLPPELVAELGTDTDAALSRKYGIAIYLIRNERLRRGRTRAPITPLPPELIAELGTDSDTALASKYGVHVPKVRAARLRAGLPKPKKKQNFPPGLLEEIGTATDTILGRKYGIDPVRIRTERLRQGLPRARLSDDAFWERVARDYPGMKERLGTVADEVLGAEYGLSRERVRQHRDRLNIPSFAAVGSEEEIAEIGPLLATHRNAQIAKITGRDGSRVAVVRKKLGVPPPPMSKTVRQELLESIRPLLGTASDYDISDIIDIPHTAVQLYRTKLGIPPATISPASKGFVPVSRERIAELFKEDKSDDEIALDVGCSPGTVGQIRKRLGLLRRPVTKAAKIDRDKLADLARQGLTDLEISKELRCSPSTVRAIRYSLRIRVTEGYRPRVDWENIDPLLGTESDRQLGKKLGLKRLTIAHRRRKLGIRGPGRKKGGG